MKKFIKILLLFGIFSFSNAFAAYNSLGISDSAEIRGALIEEWFEAPLYAVRDYKPVLYKNNNDEVFQVKLEESDSYYSIIVAPEIEMSIDIYTDEGITTEIQKAYPSDAQGSWVLIKDKKTEEPIHIRYYFLRNSEVYIQFSPFRKSSLSDLVIFGGYAAKGVPTGLPFDFFYTASIEDVMSVTKTNIPWNYVQVEIERYESVRQMAAVIKETLPDIVFLDSAMYDENGDLVNVFTGNPITQADFANAGMEFDETKLYLSSAGFLKWVADGLVEPITGGQLRREALITPTVQVKENGYQGTLSRNYNLFFGLNWVRNLASAIVSVYTGSKYLYDNSGVDVTIQPFASEVSHNKTSNALTFVSDSGYTIGGLKTLFYVLATTDPETFYLGAIREIDRTVTPEVKAFNECVIFMPYFETNGRFSCFVFIDGKELSLDQFCQIYAENFVYLTKVKSSERFYPTKKNLKD